MKVRLDELVSGTALAFMVVVPVVELALRPFLGRGVDNAAVLVQHLGLLLAMLGAVAAERHGHLSTLGGGLAGAQGTRIQHLMQLFARASTAFVCGALALASWRFVQTEIQAGQILAYGVPVWWVQAAMPLGFALIGLQLGRRCITHAWLPWVCALLLPIAESPRWSSDHAPRRAEG